MRNSIKQLRRDPVSPCADFWRAVRIGMVMAIMIFIFTWGLT